MLKKSFFAYALAAAMAMLLGVSMLAGTALAADLTQQTLTADSVTVVGLFEDGATLTVAAALTSEKAVKELTDRKQISSSKNIVAVYDISISGEQAETPIYTITIKNTKLNPLVKNKISVIDKSGAYYAISGFDYNNSTITFKTDTLGQIIIYNDPTIFYVVVSIVGGIVVLVVALKVIEAKQLKASRKKKSVTIRERDKKYHW